jgi:hypothetical protein
LLCLNPWRIIRFSYPLRNPETRGTTLWHR